MMIMKLISRQPPHVLLGTPLLHSRSS